MLLKSTYHRSPFKIDGVISVKSTRLGGSARRKENYDDAGPPGSLTSVLNLRQARRHNEKSDSRHKSEPSRGRAIGLVLLLNIHRSLPRTMAGLRDERARFSAINAKRTSATIRHSVLLNTYHVPIFVQRIKI